LDLIGWRRKRKTQRLPLALDAGKRRDAPFSILDDSDGYHKAALRAVVTKALDSLQEVKDIWRNSLKSQHASTNRQRPLSVVEGDKSA
jgi:hypothetical protein